MNFNNFDKEIFDQEIKETEKQIKQAFWAAFIISTIFGLATLGGFGWLVYVLLKYFGIVG